MPLAASASRWLVLVVGLLLACVISIVTAIVLEHFDPRFRTRDEVEATLELPVLAAVPAITRR